MLHNLFLGDDELGLRDSGRPFAKAVHFKTEGHQLVEYNCVCPVDELTPIEGLDYFNEYVRLAQEDYEYEFGIQLKVKDL